MRTFLDDDFVFLEVPSELQHQGCEARKRVLTPFSEMSDDLHSSDLCKSEDFTAFGTLRSRGGSSSMWMPCSFCWMLGPMLVDQWRHVAGVRSSMRYAVMQDSK
eukprot:symbB.v1.2.041795.t1/scaffold8649.1/size5495/2